MTASHIKRRIHPMQRHSDLCLGFWQAEEKFLRKQSIPKHKLLDYASTLSGY
jgi:hypothetical protein